jgi:hypothetical protein
MNPGARGPRFCKKRLSGRAGAGLPRIPASPWKQAILRTQAEPSRGNDADRGRLT